MDKASSAAENSCSRPEIVAEKLSNGTCVPIDDALVLFDSKHDARLEGCAERVKNRRLEWLATQKVDVFKAILSELSLLLPFETNPNNDNFPEKIPVGQLRNSKLAAAARPLALKYLLDRVGFSSRLIAQNRVELLNPHSLATITLPCTWSESEMQEWLLETEIKRFFDELDRERISANCYSLENRIYKGNLSSIYECFYEGKKCAAKVVNVDELDPTKFSSCWRELCLLREVGSHSSCIINYYGYRLEETKPRQLVMLMDKAAQSVANAISAAPFTAEEMDATIRHLLKGLVFLHERHIIHRDLKLANCLLQRDSAGALANVFIADFGLARKRSEDKPWVAKSAGSTRWMAPEVLAGKRSDLRSDIWSFGMTVVELVNRTPPYHTITVFDVPNLIANKKLPEIIWPSEPLQEPAEAIMSRIKALVKLCLQFDPALRPTAIDLLKSFQSD